MRKLIAFLLAAGMLHTAAYANISLNITECGTDGNVAISGTSDNAGTDSFVGLRVLKNGVTLSELNGDPTAELSVTEFVDQTDNAAGEAEFSFRIVLPDGESGYRQARLTGDDESEIRDFILWYVTAEDYQAAVAAVNGALSDFVAFQTACADGENALYLGFDENISDGMNNSEVLQILYRSIKDNGLSATDRVETVRQWRAASLAALLNQKSVNPSDYSGSLKYFDDTVAEWTDFVSDRGNAAVTRLQALLMGQNYQTLDQFERRMKEALILTVAQYHNGVNNIGKILNDFNDVTNITTDAETAIYQQLAGSYTSLSALLEKYNSLKSSTSQGGTSSSGGGGGTGGGASGGNLRTGGAGEFTPPEPVKMQFVDLDMADWAYEAITTLADRGIISGRTETIFAPLDTVTREEFVKLLVCAAGYENRDYTSGRFADVQTGEWYEKYVCIAAETGLANGIEENRFGIGDNITRQDMAVMIYRALVMKGTAPDAVEPNFADGEQIDDYAKEAVGALSGSGLVNGVGNNQFDPAATATRAEAAQILYNVCLRIS